MHDENRSRWVLELSQSRVFKWSSRNNKKKLIGDETVFYFDWRDEITSIRTLSLLICSFASDRLSRSAAYRKRRRRFFTSFPTASRHLCCASSELPPLWWFKSNSGGMNLSIFGNLSRRILYGRTVNPRSFYSTKMESELQQRESWGAEKTSAIFINCCTLRITTVERGSTRFSFMPSHFFVTSAW